MSFGEVMNNVGTSLAGAGAAIDQWGQHQLGPAMGEVGTALDTFGKERLGPAAEQAGIWIKEHPVQTATIVASGVTFVAPGMLSAPLLWGFGWGGAGVRAAQGEKTALTKATRAGSAAAAVQAGTGNVVAGSAFATLQSAAMGGYGAAVVGGSVRAGAVVAGGLGWLTGLGAGGEENAGVVVAEVETDRVEEEDLSEDGRGEAESEGENDE